MTGTLAGKVGVVTGAAQGLGLAIARGLMEAGASVVALDREEAPLDGDALVVRADVTDPGAVAAAVEATTSRFGRLDFLVNNAGIRLVAPFLEQPLEDFRRTLDVNVTGAFICARAVLPTMLAAGHGKIINIGSGAGSMALHDRSAYSASKAAVAMLTRSIAYEFGARGISCNGVAPGVVETPLTAHYLEDGTMREMILANTPLPRWGQPDDVAAAVVFPCGPGADYIQGEMLTVDGGWSIGKGF